MRVLIVDDDAAIRSLLARLMEGAGLLAAVAANAAEARRIARDWQPDVLLADVCLGAENGIELALGLSDDDPDLRVVVITGSDDVDGVCWPVVTKPFDLDHLLAVVLAAERAS
jgi:DNA-binding NtrC family response regulator